MSVREFIAFRGTDRNYGRQVLENKYWGKSEGKDEYFGHGVYFFEEDYNEALNWAKYTRKISDKDIVIIWASIKCERSKILDLLNSVTHREYMKIIDAVYSKYKDSEEVPKFGYPYDCELINLICDKLGYKLVRGAYSPNHKQSMFLIKKGVTRHAKTHIQLCVRDTDIINDYCLCMY